MIIFNLEKERSALAMVRGSVAIKGPFIATQLNSTRRRVELSCVAIDGPLYMQQQLLDLGQMLLAVKYKSTLACENLLCSVPKEKKLQIHGALASRGS